MENRTLELNIISAKDLNNVNMFFKMKVYATILLSGDPVHSKKAKTRVHVGGGCNPTWNHPVKFKFKESLVQQNCLSLEVTIISNRTFGSDTIIGTVKVPLRELLNDPKASDKNFWPVTYQVMRPSGKPKGSLHFSYKLGLQDSLAVGSKQEPAMTNPQPTTDSKHEQVMAYAPHAATVTGASFPPYGNPNLPLPPQYPAGYGYPPPHVGYGYLSQSSYWYPPHGYPPAPLGYGYSGHVGDVSQESYMLGADPQHPGHGYPHLGYPTQFGYGYDGSQPAVKRSKLGADPPQPVHGYPRPLGYPTQSGYGYSGHAGYRSQPA